MPRTLAASCRTAVARTGIGAYVVGEMKTAAAADGNLDSRAETMQLRVGVVFVAIALAVAVVLSRSGVAAGWRAVTFAPLAVGTYGTLAALERVCGFTALAGRRIREAGTEPIADRDELAALRRIGLRVIGTSVAIAAAATALLVLAR